MAVQSDTLVVLFVDICDSTRLYQELGDGVAHKLAMQCLNCMTEATERNGGTVIKTTGDGAMVSFRAVEQAYRAATNIQQSMGVGPLRVKIGFHVGPVIMADGDVFGNTVNLAARLLARSGPGEILMSRACVDTLSPLQRATVRLLDATIVKGQPDAVEIYRAVTDRENVTTIAATRSKTDADAAIVLTFAGETIRIGSTAPSVLIGRDARCRLVVRNDCTSRHHATIEVQRNGFVLTDHSTNGTFIIDSNSDEQYLHRESALLTGEGTISIGMAPHANLSGLIKYRNEGAAFSDLALSKSERLAPKESAPHVFTANIASSRAVHHFQSWN